MKYKWLNFKKNNKLLLFFNGWGMDENVVQHLNFDNYDVVMFYDYSNLETDFKIENKYNEADVIAWSMGVMIAGIVTPKFGLNIKHSTAINGTAYPIDAKYGINPKIYDLTIKNFNKQNAEKFIENMFNCQVPKILRFHLHRTTENQKNELIALKQYKGNPEFTYNKVLISKKDKIIPAKNQSSFWKIEPNLNAGHCPFFDFTHWSELL